MLKSSSSSSSTTTTIICIRLLINLIFNGCVMAVVNGETVVDVWINAARWGGDAALDDMNSLFNDDMFAVDVLDESTHETALQIASSSGRSRITKWLIERGADVDAAGGGGGSTPLMHAARRGHTSIAKQLLDANADALVKHKRSGWTALHLAALRLDSDIVKMLVEYNVDTCSCRDKKNRTPLDLAVPKDGSDEVVEMLSSFCSVLSSEDDSSL